MKTRFQKTNKLLIVLAMIVNLGTTAFSQIAVSDSTISIPLSCDASFKDMLPLILLPANTNMTNLVALGPVDQNNYNKEYFWDLGDGTLDTGMLITHNSANPGGYLVTLRTVQHIIGTSYSHNVVCSHKQWVTVGNVIPLLCDASFRPHILQTLDIPSSYSSVVGYEAQNKTYKSYHWDFGDGTKDTGRSVSHHFVNEGKYLVSLTVKDDNCEDTKTIWMTKKGYYFPIDSTSRCDAKISQSVNKQTVTLLDQNQVLTLIADGNYETRTWDFGDGFTAEGNNVTHTYAKAGKYMAALTKSSYYNRCFGNPACFAAPVLKCTKTQQIEVVIGEPESKCKAEISHKITNNSLEIQDNIVYAYTLRDINTISERRHWDFGDGNDTVSNNPVSHTYTSSGKYRVRLIKSLLNDPCPFIHDTLPRCMALPFLICMDTTYLDVEIRKPCKANFETSIKDSTVTIVVNPISIVFGTLPVYKIDPVEMITAPSSMYSRLDFGDGSFEESNVYNYKTTHTYAKKGDYTICLYVATVPDSVLPYTKLSYYCNDTFCKTITISDSASKPIVASIYPNPASDYMTISVQNNFNKMDLRLYDQTGKLKKEVFEILSDSKEIDTNGLENGLYFYTLSDGENIVLKGKIAVSK